MKKLTALAILIMFCTVFSTPVLAIDETVKDQPKTKKEKKLFGKNKKEKTPELKAKVEYVNTDWWADFQDPYLNEYIARALQKNHDMKIATISTNEYYQNYNIQVGAELPQIGVGFSPALVKLPGISDSVGAFALPGISNNKANIFIKNREKTKSVQKQYEASIID